MAISQSILETGWFKYDGSAVKPEHHNYCGLGVTSTGIEGGKFDTIEDGVTAQLQHLFAYGCKDTLSEPIIDPRFKYVTRGIAPYWEQLAGRWAVPGFDGSDAESAIKAGNTYGQKILKIRNSLLVTIISDEDAQKYSPTQETTKTESEKAEVEENTDGKEQETTSQPETVQRDGAETPSSNVAETKNDSTENTSVEDEKVANIVEIILKVLEKLFIKLGEIFSKK